MDPDFLIELFAGFGPITLRRMFGGYGVSADGVNFALVLRGAIYLRADEATVPRFASEGSQPFQYQAQGKTRVIASYWRLPERLYDDPDELADWARAAQAAAERAALTKRSKASRAKAGKAPKAANKTAKNNKSAKSRRARA